MDSAKKYILYLAIILILIAALGLGLFFYFEKKYEETGNPIYRLSSVIATFGPLFIAVSIAFGFIIKINA